MLFAGNRENLKDIKYHTFSKKKRKRTLVFLYYLHKCKNEDDKIFREEESNEILKILGLFKNI